MRFRPRFSLKWLMLFVAAIAIFCAYHVNWIRQRHEFLARNAARTAEHDDWRQNTYSPKRTYIAGSREHVGPLHRKTPIHTFHLLCLFGEPRHDTITLVYQVDRVPRYLFDWNNYFSFGDRSQEMQDKIPKGEVELAERLFPETDFRFVIYDLEYR